MPITLAVRVINRLCHSTLITMQNLVPSSATALREAQTASMKLYEDAWINTCHKVALDSYRRPFIFVVPPQLLAASLVYISETLLLRLALFKATNHMAISVEKEKLGSTVREQDAFILGFKSPQANSSSLSMPMTGLQVLKNDFCLTENSLLGKDWLSFFPRCSLCLDDVLKLASIFIEDTFYGF